MMEVDLDKLALSQASFVAWQEMAGRIVEAISQADVPIDLKNVPDEQARVEINGTLTIYVTIPGLGEISMSVPSDQWSYINPLKY